MTDKQEQDTAPQTHVVVTPAMVEAAKSAYWHEVHNGGGYSDKCYEAALRAALTKETDNVCTLADFRKFVDLIEGRAMACDGPVTPFLEQLHVASEAEKERFTAILAKIYQSRPATEEQIKHMVDRFLSWRLPEDFSPDAGITFKREFNENTPFPMKHEPSGTNLLDARQAETMIRYLLDGLPAPQMKPAV